MAQIHQKPSHLTPILPFIFILIFIVIASENTVARLDFLGALCNGSRMAMAWGDTLHLPR
jgi:hypothetical protein